MKVLIVSTGDIGGGAAIAAYRLLHALVENGHEARMLVREKASKDPLVTAVGEQRRFPVGIRLSKAIDRGRLFAANGFSLDKLWLTDLAWAGCGIDRHPLVQWADVIHLHWIGQGFVRLKELDRLLHSGKKVVWTLHDLWPLTGICHYPHDCREFQHACGRCPQLCRPSTKDFSHRVFEAKRRMLAKAPEIVFTGVSSWTTDMVKDSALLQHHRLEVVPNLIDTGIPVGQTPKSDRPVILFGAARIDHRIKGFTYLCQALQEIVRYHPETADTLKLVTFGENRDPELFRQVPVWHEHLGPLNADQLGQAYDQAWVVVNSSLYETFGLTLIEGALHACAPVAFAGSGPDDIITSGQNGWLARHLNPQDLAEGLMQALKHHVEWGQAARRHVLDTYSANAVAKAYTALYEA